jgi:hypothetical protein
LPQELAEAGTEFQPESRQEAEGASEASRLNFTTMADIPEGAPFMTGIFSVLNYPAIIII